MTHARAIRSASRSDSVYQKDLEPLNTTEYSTASPHRFRHVADCVSNNQNNTVQRFVLHLLLCIGFCPTFSEVLLQATRDLEAREIFFFRMMGGKVNKVRYRRNRMEVVVGHGARLSVIDCARWCCWVGVRVGRVALPGWKGSTPGAEG